MIGPDALGKGLSREAAAVAMAGRAVAGVTGWAIKGRGGVDSRGCTAGRLLLGWPNGIAKGAE